MIGGTSPTRMWAVACLAAFQAGALAGCDQSGDATVAEAATVAATVAATRPAVVQPTVSSPAPLTVSTVRIEFDPPILDLGPVVPNKAASGTVMIKNVGDRHVRILSVKPSCKCTTIGDLTGTVIAPGASVPLEAELEPQPITGLRTATIYVIFEGAAEPYQLDLRAEVTLAVRISPSILNLASGETSGHVVVTAIDGRVFNILAANRRAPVFVDFDPEFDEPRSSYMLRWDLTQETLQRALDTWWIIETDHPEAPLTDAWVRHRTTIIQPPGDRRWKVPARRSIIGFLDQDVSKDFTIDIKSMGNDEIYTVRSLSRDFNAELVSFERKGVDAVCTVRITPKAGFTGLLYGRIELLASSGTCLHDVIGKVS
ncbi:MAG: DUF1573 domain-containing protein [Phycisphaerales bacterium]